MYLPPQHKPLAAGGLLVHEYSQGEVYLQIKFLKAKMVHILSLPPTTDAIDPFFPLSEFSPSFSDLSPSALLVSCPDPFRQNRKGSGHENSALLS